jgi:hypothetical protein
LRLAALRPCHEGEIRITQRAVSGERTHSELPQKSPESAKGIAIDRRATAAVAADCIVPARYAPII